MIRLKSKSEKIQISCALIPIILSVLIIVTGKLIFLAIEVISLFLIVGICPVCRKRENLWMFLFVSVASVPLNIYYSYKFIESKIFYFGNIFVDIIAAVVLFFMLFSLEQIVFALVTRIIWKRQYKWPEFDLFDD